jgi:hypothetical protein
MTTINHLGPSWLWSASLLGRQLLMSFQPASRKPWIPRPGVMDKTMHQHVTPLCAQLLAVRIHLMILQVLCWLLNSPETYTCHFLWKSVSNTGIISGIHVFCNVLQVSQNPCWGDCKNCVLKILAQISVQWHQSARLVTDQGLRVCDMGTVMVGNLGCKNECNVVKLELGSILRRIWDAPLAI